MQQQQAAYAAQQHYFKEAAARGAGLGVGGHQHAGMPPHMLGPGGFNALHYLKQPGVMLTSLGPVDTTGGHQLGADQYTNGGGMQELRSAVSLPDVIQQQQQAQLAGAGKLKSAEGLGQFRNHILNSIDLFPVYLFFYHFQYC